MKGTYRSTPPTPRYKTTWDVQLVLTHLSSFPPVADLRPLELLTLKTIMLVALVTAQRGQSLHMLDINLMTEFDDNFEFALEREAEPSGTPTTIY